MAIVKCKRIYMKMFINYIHKNNAFIVQNTYFDQIRGGPLIIGKNDNLHNFSFMSGLHQLQVHYSWTPSANKVDYQLEPSTNNIFY